MITFTSTNGGPGVNTFPSVYTPAGTSAGSFGGATFTGADSPVSCPSPCLLRQPWQLAFFQLPAAHGLPRHDSDRQQRDRLAASVPAPIPPRQPLYNGDKVWSAAFPFGTTMGQIVPASQFVEAGTNNFTDGDQLQVGNNTYKFQNRPKRSGRGCDRAELSDFRRQSRRCDGRHDPGVQRVHR